MSKIANFIFSLFCMLLILFGCGSNSNSQLNESKEQTQSKRIVSTTVALTEIFAELDLDLVGVPTSESELPNNYSTVTEVGSPMSPELEIIKTLMPDMVYSTKSLESSLSENFINAEIPVEFVDLTSISSMITTISKLGSMYERESEAETLITNIQEQLTAVKTKVADEDEVSVLVLMGLPGSYIVATENSYLGDLVSLAGGKNVISDVEGEYISANTEVLQATNPDIILRAAHGMPEEVVEMFAEEFKTNDIWQHFDAVKNNRVYDLDYELFGMTASLKSPKALINLEQILHEK